MGVVRREGDWRLNKRDDGVYEITYQKNVQTKVLTPDYNPGMVNDAMFDAVPVREVGSYSEAEGLFEEMAHEGPPFGFGSMNASDSLTANTGFDDFEFGRDLETSDDTDLEDIDLPPGGIALALLLAGVLVISSRGFDPTSTVFLVGGVLAIGGLAIFGWAGMLYKTNGLSEAIEFLVTSKDESSTTESASDTTTTPPTPEKLKNALIFDRARQRCEWCEERFDHPHVHHIEPRREGGPNTPKNLIVLCPNCHEKADRNAIPRSKLNAKVNRLPEIVTE